MSNEIQKEAPTIQLVGISKLEKKNRQKETDT